MAFPSIAFCPSYQSSMNPRSGLDDQITCMTKSCQTPRTKGVLHSSTVGPFPGGGFRSSIRVPPFKSNSRGGEPQHPLWCHWVKTCHLFSMG